MISIERRRKERRSVDLSRDNSLLKTVRLSDILVPIVSIMRRWRLFRLVATGEINNLRVINTHQ